MSGPGLVAGDAAPDRCGAEAAVSDRTATTAPSAASRRGFIAAAAAAVFTLDAPPAAAQSTRRAKRKERLLVAGVPAVLASVSAPPDSQLTIWRDPVARLVRRITLGITKDELERAKALGYAKYLDEQLKPSVIDDRATNAFITSKYPTLRMSPEELYGANLGAVQTELQEATLYRAAFSKRQLHERMVEFWTDHFSIDRNQVGYLKLVDDRDVIRKHALGKFPALLKASAHSAAMMEYLDQTASRRGNINENYAREIMELHSVGVDGGYTQQDVNELARVLTGWTVSGRGIFTYDAPLHDFGPKAVLGKTVPATAAGTGLAGKGEADAIIDTLALHPRTANYIATKLTKFLLQYDPTDAMITAVATEFTRTKGDIPSMVRVILAEQNLMVAPAKYKRPFHFAVSMVRSLGPGVTSMTVIRQLVDNMGQSLFAWETPDGYPDTMEFWSGLVLARWNAAGSVVAQTGATFNFDVTPFVGTTAESGAELIVQRLLGGEAPLSYTARLADFLRPAPTNPARVREAVGLALSSTQFQWY
jgi:uncharacterized protein (DUF1800 family)